MGAFKPCAFCNTRALRIVRKDALLKRAVDELKRLGPLGWAHERDSANKLITEIEKETK